MECGYRRLIEPANPASPSADDRKVDNATSGAAPHASISNRLPSNMCRFPFASSTGFSRRRAAPKQSSIVSFISVASRFRRLR